jgi:RNA polymerase sigma factor (sigma-70 family)
MSDDRGARNPLTADDPADPGDRDLVARARTGDSRAVDELVRRHQAWIYNIAVRMLHHPQDAEDATQEVLVKALTRLPSFEGRSSFRTWLYRIVVNHVLNTRRGRREPEAMTFGCYGHGLDATPDLDVADDVSAPADVRLLVDEARLTCTSGMLLCLDREQRVLYILGEIFGVTDALGAELLEISRENFRQRLARARRDLHSFMHDKCGLVDAANPCRCARKTRGFIRAGYVDPTRLLFAREHVRQVREVTATTAEVLSTLDRQCGDVFRQHPFHASPDLVPAMRRLLQSPGFHRATDLPSSPVPLSPLSRCSG